MTESMRPNLVSDDQRDRALDYLQQAYAKGAIDSETFEDRMSQALTATTRGELNASLRGIARVAPPSMPMPMAPVALPQVPDRLQNVGAGLVHMAGLPTGFIGPAIVKALAPKGSRLWWEAGRAMAWQATALLTFIAIIAVSLFLGLEGLVFVSFLAWVGLTVFFGVRALNGDDSTGAFGRMLPFQPKHRD